MSTTSYGRNGSANRYLSDSLATAGPAALLVLLYDRLILDLQRAEVAQAGNDRENANRNLLHAQDIVMELHSSLDVEAWDGGPGLSSLYTWLLTELAQINVTGDAARTEDVRRRVVEPLADAWRQASVAAQAGAVAAGANGLA